MDRVDETGRRMNGRGARAVGVWGALFAVVVGSSPRAASADAPGTNDRAINLVDSLVLTKLADMDGLRSASLAESPWSSDVWPHYKGGIAYRYSDPGIQYTQDWHDNVDAVWSTTPANPDDLSPAEKYDLLVGDVDQRLTAFHLDLGQPYYQHYGVVEPRMDIDHGWAAASYMTPRPLKAIVVPAADGVTQIKFYPEDIKALASALWAYTTPVTKFIGGRCNAVNPAIDSIGRIKETACRDANPASWHLAVVNQIGKAKRSFVVDTTYDYEVTNKPVHAYSYEYFNPKTKQTTKILSYAKVAVGDFPEDKFKSTRAAGTTHIVGVTMDVKWSDSKAPSHYAPDSPSWDAITGARWMYTLELDASGTIIGGEWLQKAHPDFQWTPPPGTKAATAYEGQASGSWSGLSALPASWRTAAVSSSATGAPLAKIVDKLVELARK